MPQVPSNPLGKIALSCSGGGYRAASFHLGAMSYLQRLQYRGKPLLENVRMISTVSGGTITGVIYALKKQEGWSFEQVYDFILQKLRTLDLVKEGIEKLNTNVRWDNPSKRKNLINAFAELYDREFTGSKTFSEFDTMKSHLEAVVFNSTEFNNGINFRFRNSGTGYFGNFKIRVPQQLSSEVKLADAIAASSCFTGGFEPLIWPQDFVHAQSPALQQYAATATPIGLMDGGIYDNQGIESILNYKSDQPEPYFDLVIISDVASPYMKAYAPAIDKAKEGIRQLTIEHAAERLRMYNTRISVGLLLLVLAFAVAPLLWGYSNTWPTGFCIGLSLCFLCAFIGKWMLQRRVIRWKDAAIASVQKKVPRFFVEKLSHLKIEALSIRRAEPLILDRINSLITLLMDVFLKVVRRLNYYKLYDNERYIYRRMSNLIRELTEADFREVRDRRGSGPGEQSRYTTNSVLQGKYEDVVGANLKLFSETASSFGTTLWFTEDEQLANMLGTLVACGQATMCYNMLDYLEHLLFDDKNGFDKLDRRDTTTAIAAIPPMQKRLGAV